MLNIKEVKQMKNLIEKNQEALLTNDGYLISKYFAGPLGFKKSYNKALG